MPKRTQTREDITVKVNIKSLIHPYIFSQQSKDLGVDEALYIYLHCYILPCLCTFWHAIPISLIILMTSYIVSTVSIMCNHNHITELEVILSYCCQTDKDQNGTLATTYFCVELFSVRLQGNSMSLADHKSTQRGSLGA